MLMCVVFIRQCEKQCIHNLCFVNIQNDTIFDIRLYLLSEYRACQAGIGRGDGWIIPLNIYIETMQFIPQQCTIFENIGM